MTIQDPHEARGFLAWMLRLAKIAEKNKIIFLLFQWFSD
jgi:hypothetical protein